MPVQTDIRGIREEAKQLLKTAQVPPLRFTLLFLALDLALMEISTAVSHMLGRSIGIATLSFSFVDIFISLLSTVLLAGYTCYCLGVTRGLEMPYDSLFDAFPFAGRVILLMVLQGVLIGVGFVLFIVPGVILAFSYAFALYYLCEDPDVGVVESLRRSRLALKGNKTRLFTLLLSFLPLLLLFALPLSLCQYFLRGVFPETLGGELLDTLVTGLLDACASVYLTPYLALAQILFFRRVTENAESPQDNAPEF